MLLHALANVPGPDYHALPAAQQEAAVEGFTGALAGMLHAAKLLHDRWGVAGNERLRLFEASRRAIRSYLKQPARGIETRVKGS